MWFSMLLSVYLIMAGRHAGIHILVHFINMLLHFINAARDEDEDDDDDGLGRRAEWFNTQPNPAQSPSRCIESCCAVLQLLAESDTSAERRCARPVVHHK